MSLLERQFPHLPVELMNQNYGTLIISTTPPLRDQIKYDENLQNRNFHIRLSFLKLLDKAMLSGDIMDYHVVAQGKTSIPGVDDGEEMTMTDVRAPTHFVAQLFTISSDQQYYGHPL